MIRIDILNFMIYLLSLNILIIIIIIYPITYELNYSAYHVSVKGF